MHMQHSAIVIPAGLMCGNDAGFLRRIMHGTVCFWSMFSGNQVRDGVTCSDILVLRVMIVVDGLLTLMTWDHQTTMQCTF